VSDVYAFLSLEGHGWLNCNPDGWSYGTAEERFEVYGEENARRFEELQKHGMRVKRVPVEIKRVGGDA